MKTKLTLETLGLSGEAWIKRLEEKNFRLTDYAKDILKSKDFKSEKGSYEIIIVKAEEVGEYPTTSEIRNYAKNKGYLTPSAEIACLIREEFSDEDIKEMGLWAIITMHEPIKDSDGSPSLLGASRWRWSLVVRVRRLLRRRGGRERGFAFVVSQDSSLSSEPQDSDLKSLDLRLKKLEKWMEAMREVFKQPLWKNPISSLKV